MLPLKLSTVPSKTKFTNVSKPFSTPVTSRPPVNLTLTFFSKYRVKSKILSFFLRSFGTSATF